MGKKSFSLCGMEVFELFQKLQSHEDFEFKGHVYTSFRFSDECSRQVLLAMLQMYPVDELFFHKAQCHEQSEERLELIYSHKTSLFHKQKNYKNLVYNNVTIDLVVESPIGTTVCCSITMSTDSIKQQKSMLKGDKQMVNSGDHYTEKVIACSVM